ncbi:PilC/PilY family type IV pilus protein [Snodgrassella communis]|uniref:PilC/PilY family type IV pilus protein n=1 Tax=Snodgrassella communis TaxID=2946699 RepID=UPI0023B2586F|nr:PilC/PilY family type IV pilus protein [Snodgrassella communis]
MVAEGGKGSLSSPFAFDINGDNVADIVYAGDYVGNLFRFDIRDPDPSKWRGVKIFTAGQPITAAPLVLKADQNGSSNQKLVVVFGTDSDLYDQDLEKRDQQAIYGIYDNYNLTDSTALVSKQDLLQQTISVSGSYRSISKNEFDPARYKGWYIDLDPADGERVVSSTSRLLTTGIIPKRIYEVKKGVISAKEQDPCSSEIFTQDVSAETRMMQFNLRTGSGLSEHDSHIVFDKNNPLSITSKKGIFGYEIMTDINSNIGGTGNWQSLGSTPPSPDRCMDKLPVVGTTEGLIDQSDIKNVLCAPITFKVLS